MANPPDAKTICTAQGPEVLDLTTLQGLAVEAIERVQRLRAQQEAGLRKEFRGVPTIDEFCALDPTLCDENGSEYVALAALYFIEHVPDLALALARAGYTLLMAIGQEYARAVVDPLQLERLLDITQERVANYARNRLIQVVRGKPIWKWTSSATPSRAELNFEDLWVECEKISDLLGLHSTKVANDLKAEAWARHAEGVTTAAQISIGTRPMVPAPAFSKSPPHVTPDDTPPARCAAIDHFLLWTNDELGRGEVIFQGAISEAAECTLRTLQSWKNGKTGPKSRCATRIRSVLNDPTGFVERFKSRPAL